MRIIYRILFLLLLLIQVVACQSSEPPPTSTQVAPAAALPTAVPLPSIYPTFTPNASGSIPTADTPTPQPIPPTSTPVDFSKPVITFRYEIPALGLDRRFEGTLGSDVRLVDMAAGTAIDLPNQARALLEIQNVLSNLQTLAQPPADCNGRCVLLTYDLPVEGKSGSGWLQDDILLASIEFFFANNLGAHFPPNTVAGLHRSASGYNVSHTAAVLTDGTVWRWQATDPQIPEPTIGAGAIINLIPSLPLNLYENVYTADCPYFPTETMHLSSAAATRTINLICPELTLPTTLIPIYGELLQLADQTLDPERNIPLPTQLLPLDGLLFYQRADGATLSILKDGTQVAIDAAGQPYTSTIAVQDARDLIDLMASSNILPRGVAIANDPEALEETESLLLMRNELGVYELGWSDNIGQGLLPPILTLDEWLINEVGFIGDVVAPTPTLESSATILITATVPVTATIPITITVTPTP